MLASLVVPALAGVLVEWGWAPGLVLVDLGVLTTVAALLGLSPTVHERAPVLARTGAVGAAAAGVAGLGLLALLGSAVMVLVTANGGAPEPVGLFGMLVLGVAAGLAVSFLSFGVVIWRDGGRPTTAGKLLTGGGTLLLAAVVGELLRSLVGVGPPPAVVFPVVLLVAVDLLAIGRSL